MVNIIKKPTAKSKGVIIFTHKELRILGSGLSILDEMLSRLSKKYLIGMHWGGHSYNVEYVPHVQFHLGAQGAVTLHSKNPTPLIHLCSRNFLPNEFRLSDFEKVWDIIAVGRCVPIKRHEDFLGIIRTSFDLRPKTRVLLIAPVVEGYRDYPAKLAKLINKLFSAEEQDYIDCLMPQTLPIRKFLPMSHASMASFFQMSRVFVHTSASEGNVRVLHEALLCGLPCVVRRNMVGGGHDYLNALNSRYFETNDEGGRQIFSLLEDPPDIRAETENLGRELTTRYSLPRLEHVLKELFVKLGEPYDGGLEPGNYAQILSSHTQNLPREWTVHPNSDDLVSPEALAHYAGSLLDERPRKAELNNLRRAWVIKEAERRTKRMVRGLRRRLGFVQAKG